MIGMSWFEKMMASMWISMFDTVAYNLASGAYTIFNEISKINMFATGEAANVYSLLCKRIYVVLSIVMIFIFAYQLILLIINPDGDKKAPTSIVKDVVVSLILITLLPTIFNYMHVFERHVLSNQTITAIVLGNAGTTGDDTGSDMTLMMLMSMYHPAGTTYSTFMNSDGTIKTVDEVKERCINTATGASSETCEAWYKATYLYTNQYIEDGRYNVLYRNIGCFTLLNEVTNKIGDDGGIEYMWGISTVAALLVAWFFVSYSLDLGTRAVKLAFLEIIAPIPVILRPFPKMKKTFEVWFGEIKKTYLEIFLRVALVSFVVLIASLVPTFIDIVFGSLSNSSFYCIALAIIILGLLKFAKEAPQLIKTMLDNGGNLFAGLNFKPGVKRRIEENDYAMKGINMTTGAVGGLLGNFGRKFADEKAAGADNSVALMKALTAAPRGLITGAISGAKSQNRKLSDLGEEFWHGSEKAQASGARVDEKRAPLKNAIHHAKDAASNAPVTGLFSGENAFINDMIDNYFIPEAESNQENMKYKTENFLNRITGQQISGTGATELENLNTVLKTPVGNFKKIRDDEKKTQEPYKNLFTTGNVVEFNGQYYSRNGILTNNQTTTNLRTSTLDDLANLNYSYRDTDGKYVDQNGYLVNANGQHINANGNVTVDVSEYIKTSKKYGTYITDSHGRRVDANGRYINNRGRYEDENGREVDVNGRYVVYDKNGKAHLVDINKNYVNDKGILINDAGGYVDKSGNVINVLDTEGFNNVLKNAQDAKVVKKVNEKKKQYQLLFSAVAKQYSEHKNLFNPELINELNAYMNKIGYKSVEDFFRKIQTKSDFDITDIKAITSISDIINQVVEYYNTLQKTRQTTKKADTKKDSGK